MGMGLFLLVCVFLGNVRIQMIVASTFCLADFSLFFFFFNNLFNPHLLTFLQ